MKALVIGSGGREHAIAWKLAQSEEIEKVYVAPGNGGTAREDKCENLPFGKGPAELSGTGPVSPQGQAALAAFAGEKGVGLTVVGPEDPLGAGIVDLFRARGLAVVGPGSKAARFETSKAFSKEFMKKYGVRTAAGREFTRAGEALDEARRHFADPETRSLPMVIKADGLTAGKGVTLAEDLAAAENTVTALMRDKSLGEAGASVVIEDFLPGREVSVLAAVSVVPGKRGVIRPFIAARDHKRRFEGGRGPNTGGMGAVAPVPDFDGQAQRDFLDAILEPTLKGMEAEGLEYRGFIFFGLMVNAGRCSLLEYNARLGDPETQALLPLLDSDFPELCRAILDGGLGDFPLSWKPGAVCAPVAVAEGYPGPYRKGDPIRVDGKILAETGAKLFIAGALWDEAPQAGGPGLRTSGGRVLAASAYGAGPEEARERAYRALEAVGFAGKSCRRDIGRE
ncbi:MAG: phosphoribosylamine--glycine ligase [Treponema sp.]|jgi:phosphoribosylamine--glycine ligase|nr:phosphoribosylamine--glycine ligase [Treponema sp.]